MAHLVGPEIAIFFSRWLVPATVTSSRPITLFSPAPMSRTGPSPFVVSAGVHCVVLWLIFLAIKNAPNIVRQLPDQRYTVRLLKLQAPEPRMRWSPGTGGATSAPETLARAHPAGGRLTAPSAPQQLAQRLPASRTLVQPNAPPDSVLLAETPIPTVVLWRPENAPTPKITPPAPQKTIAANVTPALARPNQEMKIADLQLSSTAFTSNTLPLPASTTSPVKVPVPGVAVVPESASKTSDMPTPATVLSVSDVIVAKGTVALPLANETAAVSPSDSLMPGRPDSDSNGETGIASDKQNGRGPGENPGGHGNTESAANGTGGNRGAGYGSSSGSDSGSLLDNQSMVDRIALPRNGEYGVVVVGASLADEYPETHGIWAGRLAYTVYLHVGGAKSWILQYSLPHTVQAAANAARPDAPWPYLIVRPHLLPSDSDADAVMVHGFIDTGGRFQQLAVVFPPQFAQTKFVLGSLQQWQFRPAAQNGRQTSVEVLLIIPEESE